NQHGIAKFIELQRRKVAGARSTAGEEGYREYLVLEFAPSKRGGAGDGYLFPQINLIRFPNMSVATSLRCRRWAGRIGPRLNLKPAVQPGRLPKNLFNCIRLGWQPRAIPTRQIHPGKLNLKKHFRISKPQIS